jgi:hypothetical protein
MIEIPKEMLMGDKALEPFYSISGINKNILLWDGEFNCYATNVFGAKGKVNATLLPSPSTRITFETDHVSIILSHFNSRRELQLGLLGNQKSNGRVMLDYVDPSCHNNKRIYCEGELSRYMQSEQIECDKVVFHLPNFLNYLGTIYIRFIQIAAKSLTDLED